MLEFYGLTKIFDSNYTRTINFSFCQLKIELKTPYLYNKESDNLENYQTVLKKKTFKVITGLFFIE